MKISTKGRYGLRILLDLALHGREKPRLIRDIAKSQILSEKYVSRLIISLRKARYVKSIRGAKGGYILNKNPKEITALGVVETMEGPLSIVDCVCEPKSCKRSGTCTVRSIWSDLNNEMRLTMDKITLQSIIDKNHGENMDSFDYCI